MPLLVRNTTDAAVTVGDLGFTVPADGTYDILTEGFDRLRYSQDLLARITDGTLVAIKTEGPETYWTTQQAEFYVRTGISPQPDLVGSEAMGVPRGTTAERPADGEGLLRYNTELDLLEGFFDHGWQQLVHSGDHRLNPHNEIHVHKHPGAGEFDSVQAAIDSITDASADNRYLVHIGAGTFVEPQIVLKPYIALHGMGRDVTVICAADPDNHLIVAADNTEISSLMLDETTGTGKAAIYLSSGQTVAGFGMFVDSVRFGHNNIHVLVNQPAGTSGIVYINNSVYGGVHHFDQGFVAQGAGTARVQVRNSTSVGTVAPQPSAIFKADGPLAQILVVGCLARSSIAPTGTAVHLRNGGSSRIMSLSIVGFGKGFWCENVGAAPYLNAVGVNLENNVQDIVVDHPGTTGSYNGNGNRNKVDINPASDLSIFYTDTINKGTVSVGSLFLGRDNGTLVDVLDLALRTPAMGVLQGGELSRTTGRAIHVGAGYGYLSTDTSGDTLIRVEWADQDVAVPSPGWHYVYVDPTGTIQTATTLPNEISTILLGSLIASPTAVQSFANLQFSAHHAPNSFDEFNRYALGAIYVTGSIVSENATTPAALDVTPGRYYYSTIEHLPAGGQAVPLIIFGHGGGQQAVSVGTTVPLDVYDDLTDPVPLSAGYFTKHSLYISGDRAAEDYCLIIGQAQYPTQIEAEQGLLPVPPPLLDNSAMIATIIVQQGQTGITMIQDARPVIGFKATGVSASSDHGNLLGLDEDDHKQYLLANGTRAMLGGLNMGTNPITNAGLINGVTVTAHASRHLPNGADPLATAAPAASLSLATTNSAGIANSLARSDHSHAITGVQPESAELTSLAGLTGTGVVVRNGTGSHSTRLFAGASGRISIVNDATTSTIDLATTGVQSGTYNNLTVDAYGRITSASMVTYSSETSVTLEGDVTGSMTATNAVTIPTSLSLTGVVPGTYRSLTVDSKGRVTGGTNPTTLAGYAISDAQPLDADLTALADLTTTGLIARTGNGTVAARSLTGPAAGLSVTNGNGVSGNPTLALANDLAAVEGLAGTGFAVRTAADTWTNRTISGTAGRVGVTNGDGIAGGPVVDLVTTGVAQGTYNTLTVDTYGRVTAASNTTFLTGNQTVTLSGDVTGSGTTAITTTLSNSGVTAGSYRSVTVDIKGRVTAGSNPTTLAGYAISDAQPLDTDLTALAGLTTTGLIARTAEGTAATRTITGPAAGLTVSNGDGIAANPSLALANDLAALEGLTGTGIAVRTAADAWTNRTISGGAGRIVVTNGSGVAGNPVVDLSTSGVGAGTYAGLTVDTYGRVTAASAVTTLAGYGITDAQPLDPDLTALAGLATTGLLSRTADGVIATRTILTPGAGLNITNGDGVSANPSLGLANDLLAVEALAGTGLAVRTGTDAWANRTIAGTTGRVTVTNGNGVSANPTIDLAASGVGAGTYAGLTVDTYGRITAATVQTTLAGYGITDAQPLSGELTALAGVTATGLLSRNGTNTYAAYGLTGTVNQINYSLVGSNVVLSLAPNAVMPGTGGMVVPSGTTAEQPASPAGGTMRYNNDTDMWEFYQGGAWMGLGATAGARSFQFFADMLNTPTSTDWPVAVVAPAIADPTRTSVIVRSFDDTTNEGTGFMLEVPTGVTTMTLKIRGRNAATPGSTNRGVVFRLHSRRIPDNATVPSWNTGTTLTTITPPNNQNYYYRQQTWTLTTLGLVAGSIYNFEFSRFGSTAADTLVGDFYLLELGVDFA